MTAVLYLCLSLIGGVEKSRTGNPVILDGAVDPAAGNFIYFTSPFGIYVFERQTQTWSRINQANGLPDNQIEILGLDEGVLWVATPHGLASADVRINDWQNYELPGMITGLAFDDQFVWVSGDFGLKRFDKYSETWQDLIRYPIRDLMRDRDYFWIAGDSGIARYDRRFEKIEEISGAPEYPFVQIINTPSRIWFIGEGRFAAFHKTNETWSVYSGFPVDGIASLGDSLYAAAHGRIYYYEPKIDNWVEFREIEGRNRVSNVTVNAENLLAATDAGLIVYNWRDRQWKTYNSGNGRARDSLRAAFQQGYWTFAVSGQDIEFLDNRTGIWQIEEYRPSGVRREKFLYRDEAGGHLRLNRDFEFRLQGRAFISYRGNRIDSLLRNETVNLKLIGQHRSNRMFSLYYDDSDKSDTVYGGLYRGRERDLLYRMDAGYLKSEYYETDIIPQYYHRGGDVKLRTGPVNLGFQAGQLKSAVRNDFFSGRTTHKTIRIMDINYAGYTFYYADSIPKPWTRISDTIFVDDLNPADNTPGTRIGYEIAGLTGDFDPLLNGRDYFIDYGRGLIHFLTARSAGERIVLLLDGAAFIIQTETQPGSTAENIYFLGLDIIPSSFTIAIEDTAGTGYPLSAFGLDRNGDGQIDPEYINYDLGLLTFPDPHPFPDSVHVYTMNGGYDSYSSFYFLTERPVLIGSEKVYVDGELKISGVDYVVDYTSGILLFLRPDVTSDFSEIQVQYFQRQRGRADGFYSGQPVVTIGTHLKVSPGFTHLESRNLYSGSGEFKAGVEDGDMSLRIVPQLVFDDTREWAQNHRLVGRYRFLSINARYRGYSSGFAGLGLEEGKYGRLRNLTGLNASVEPVSYVKLEGNYQDEVRLDSTGSKRSSRFLTGKASYLNPRFIGGFFSLGLNDFPDYANEIVQAGANCTFGTSRTRIKLNTQARNDDRRWNTGDEERDFGYVVNANISLPVPVRADGYYQCDLIIRPDHRDRRDRDIHGVVNFDLVPGLYCLTNYRLQSRGYYLAGAQELSLVSALYNNGNIAPGKGYLPLSFANFTFGSGTNCDEYLEDLAIGYQPPGLILGPIGAENISHINAANTYYGAVQVIPDARLKLWVRHTLAKSGLADYDRPAWAVYNLDEMRVEYEPRDIGYFLVYGYRRSDPGLPRETVDNLYGEWNKSWSIALRTKLIANYWVRQNDYYRIITGESEAKGAGETMFRFGAGSLVSLKFGVQRHEDIDGRAIYSFLPGAGLNWNLVSFLYVQFNWEAAVVWGGTTSHTGELKVTGQF